MNPLRALAALVEGLWELLHWRDDWNRTWSPVSFGLAVFCGIALLLLAIAYGQPLWDWAAAR